MVVIIFKKSSVNVGHVDLYLQFGGEISYYKCRTDKRMVAGRAKRGKSRFQAKKFVLYK